MEDKKVMAITVQPGERAQLVRDFDTSLEAMQHFVDGWVEFTYPEEGIIVLGNDEAKLREMEGNRHINGSVYAGPLAFLGDDGNGGFRDLTLPEIEYIMEEYGEPEYIPDSEVQADCGFFVFGAEDEESEILKRILLDAYFAGGGKYDN